MQLGGFIFKLTVNYFLPREMMTMSHIILIDRKTTLVRMTMSVATATMIHTTTKSVNTTAWTLDMKATLATTAIAIVIAVMMETAAMTMNEVMRTSVAMVMNVAAMRSVTMESAIALRAHKRDLIYPLNPRTNLLPMCDDAVLIYKSPVVNFFLFLQAVCCCLSLSLCTSGLLLFTSSLFHNSRIEQCTNLE